MADDTYVICPVTEPDFAQIAALEQACFSDPWSEEILRESAAHPLYRFLAAKDGHRVLGYAGMYLTIPEAQIANIAVAKEARRRGIGREILRHMVRLAEESGAEELFLEVRVHNEAAIALYEKEGFVRVGTRRNYYSDPTEDGYIYVRNLNRG